MKTKKEIRACLNVCKNNIEREKQRIKDSSKEVEKQEACVQVLTWVLQPSILRRKK